jgi:hypothetical protein
MDGKEFQSQKIKVFESLKEKPKTRLQVSFETNILRGNICYFVRDFRNLHKVAVYKKGIDPLTGHKAEYLTTDPDLFPNDNQLGLFDGTD